MKDKEKQFRQECSLIANGEDLPTDKEIEEMAKIMANCDITCNECFEQFESVMKMKIKEREKHCQAYMFAKRAIESGYRKIPEDCVVFSTEDLKQMVKARTKCVENAIIRTRKETAEKIYDELRGHGTTYVKKWIREQFGVEVEE